MQIVVNHARAILFGKVILVPGLNPDVNEDDFKKAMSKPAGRTAFEMWAKAGVLEVNPKAGARAKVANTSAGLGGLSQDKALEIIALSSDVGRLEDWFRTEKRASVKRALAARADELKSAED